MFESIGGGVPLELLKGLSKPAVSDFVDVTCPLPNSHPRKLPIGLVRDTNECIYAYMREWGEHQRIEFYAEKDDSRALIKTMDIAKHVIYHPFDKTYTAGSQELDREERIRLSLLIKWYFVQAGVADKRVLQEMANSRERLCGMFEWIRNQTSPVKQEGIFQCGSTARVFGEHPELSGQIAAPTQNDPSETSTFRKAEQIARTIIETINERNTNNKRRLSECDQDLHNIQLEREKIVKRQERHLRILEEIESALSSDSA